MTGERPSSDPPAPGTLVKVREEDPPAADGPAPIDPDKFLEFFDRFKSIENKDLLQQLENEDKENQRQFDFAKAKLDADARIAEGAQQQDQQRIVHTHTIERKLVTAGITMAFAVLAVGSILMFKGDSKAAALFFSHTVVLVSGLVGGYGYARSRPKD
jgi:hypothetical protein